MATTVYTQHDPADAGLTLPGFIRARAAEDLDSVEIVLRHDPARITNALRLLDEARTAVVETARGVKP